MSARAPALTARPAAARVPANPRVSAVPARRARAMRTGNASVVVSPRVWVIQAGSSANPHGLTGASIPAVNASASSPPITPLPRRAVRW